MTPVQADHRWIGFRAPPWAQIIVTPSLLDRINERLSKKVVLGADYDYTTIFVAIVGTSSTRAKLVKCCLEADYHYTTMIVAAVRPLLNKAVSKEHIFWKPSITTQH